MLQHDFCMTTAYLFILKPLFTYVVNSDNEHFLVIFSARGI